MDDPEPPQDPTSIQTIRHRLQTKKVNALYAIRKSTVNTVFGIIKQVLELKRFLLSWLAIVQSKGGLTRIATTTHVSANPRQSAPTILLDSADICTISPLL